jgi:hypothetical protein
VAHDPSSIEAVMKYLPIWMPVILILSMMAVPFEGTIVRIQP